MQIEILRELNLKILFSTCLVLVVMLGMQLSLNVLKFESLVGQATASQMQVSGSAIQTVISRAEQAGLALTEMTSLQILVDREVTHDPTIKQIIVTTQLGNTVVQSSSIGVTQSDIETVLRRVFSTSELETSIILGDRIFSGRQMYDSSGALMGAILLIADNDAVKEASHRVFYKLFVLYSLTFLMLVPLLLPFITYLFSQLTTYLQLLRDAPDNIKNVSAYSGASAATAKKILTGNEQIYTADAEITHHESKLT